MITKPKLIEKGLHGSERGERPCDRHIGAIAVCRSRSRPIYMDIDSYKLSEADTGIDVGNQFFGRTSR